MSGDKTQAQSLLAGLLEETADEAASAQAALEAELKQKEEEAKAKAEAEAEARRAEIAAGIAAEEARQRAAAERREAALEAMRIEELKAKGLWKEPEPEPVVVEAPKVASVVQPAPVEKSNKGLFAAAAALLILGGGAAGGWFYMNQEYVSTTPFSASTPAVVALAETSASVAFNAIPDPIIEVVEAAEEPTRRERNRNRDRDRDRDSDSGSSGSSAPTLQLGGNVGGR